MGQELFENYFKAKRVETLSRCRQFFSTVRALFPKSFVHINQYTPKNVEKEP
jgi:hypothetical protein